MHLCFINNLASHIEGTESDEGAEEQTDMLAGGTGDDCTRATLTICAAPMNGRVYQLDLMDAVGVLATVKPIPILTIPSYKGVKPFITIKFVPKLAMELIAGRTQLM